jgi:hypothetical protein
VKVSLLGLGVLLVVISQVAKASDADYAPSVSTASGSYDSGYDSQYDSGYESGPSDSSYDSSYVSEYESGYGSSSGYEGAACASSDGIPDSIDNDCDDDRVPDSIDNDWDKHSQQSAEVPTLPRRSRNPTQFTASPARAT